MLCKCQDSIILNVQKYLFFLLEESNINAGRTLTPAVTGIIVAHWSQDGELSPRHVLDRGEHTDAFIYTSSNQLYQSIVVVFSYPGNTVVDITPDSTLGMFCSIIILCSICIMSIRGVSDLSRVPRASRKIEYTPNRYDTNGLYPESAWSTYSNFYYNHRYFNTFSLVVRVSCTTAKSKKVLTL